MGKYLEEEHRECCVCRTLVSADDDRCLSGDEFVRVPGRFLAWEVEGQVHMLALRENGGPLRLLVEASGRMEDGTPLFQIWRHDPDTAGTRTALLEAFARVKERGAQEPTP